MPTIQELLEGNREEEWRRAGVPESDIALSRICGIDGRDVRTFREFSRESVLIIVRNPKVTARAWHGILPPKNIATKAKTDSSGTVVSASGRNILVSDYDLMSVWRTHVSPAAKVFISPTNGTARGKFTEEATKLIVQLNGRLVAKIQHGCQDDYHAQSNPGVKPTDHFTVFQRSLATHLPNPSTCADFYAKRGLAWPYDATGKYSGPIAGTS